MFGPANNSEFELPKKGRYVFTLQEIEERDFEYGPRAVWKFKLSPPSEPESYVTRANGEPETLWQFTGLDMRINTRQREWVEAILGRILREDEVPDIDALIDGRFVADLDHIWNKAKTKKSAYIDDKSATPFEVPKAATASKAAPKTNGTSGDGSVKETWTRSVRKAEVLGVEGVEKFKAIDPDLLGDVELIERLDELNAAIAAA
jgi:hypothetical protein